MDEFLSSMLEGYKFFIFWMFKLKVIFDLVFDVEIFFLYYVFVFVNGIYVIFVF